MPRAYIASTMKPKYEVLEPALGRNPLRTSWILQSCCMPGTTCSVQYLRLLLKLNSSDKDFLCLSLIMRIEVNELLASISLKESH